MNKKALLSHYMCLHIFSKRSDIVNGICAFEKCDGEMFCERSIYVVCIKNMLIIERTTEKNGFKKSNIEEF